MTAAAQRHRMGYAAVSSRAVAFHVCPSGSWPTTALNDGIVTAKPGWPRRTSVST